MGGHRSIFAIKDDWVEILGILERKRDLKFALMGNFLQSELTRGIIIYQSGKEIPNLGKATGEQTNLCDSYLVCEQGTELNLRKFNGHDGERVCVDQLINPNTIVVQPCGILNEDVVISGCIATTSNTKIANALMHEFRSAITNAFKKVGGYWVGPKALLLLKNGKRFTDAFQSPREYDLKLPEE